MNQGANRFPTQSASQCFYIPKIENQQRQIALLCEVQIIDQCCQSGNFYPGKAAKGILLTDYSYGNDMIVAKPGITSILGLKGKKIGLELGLVEHLLLLKALASFEVTDGR